MTEFERWARARLVATRLGWWWVDFCAGRQEALPSDVEMFELGRRALAGAELMPRYAQWWFPCACGNESIEDPGAHIPTCPWNDPDYGDGFP